MKIKTSKCEIILFFCCLCTVAPLYVAAQKQFVTEISYKKNLASQKRSSTLTLTQLRKDNVTASTKLKLAYVFHTNTKQKARELTDQLETFGYQAEIKQHPSNTNLFLITGLTMQMQMSDNLVLEWTKVMCDIGYEFDCEFKSWSVPSH